MKAIGFVASVDQISAYAFSILETMQKIRALARDGPDQLQEKVQQLDVLLMVVCRRQPESARRRYREVPSVDTKEDPPPA
jgi:hypothetical protein